MDNNPVSSNPMPKAPVPKKLWPGIIFIISIAFIIFIIIGLIARQRLISQKTPQTPPPEPEKITNEAQAKLEPQGGSAIAGQVNLLEKDGKTIQVFIGLDPFSAKNPAATQAATFSAGIYSGTCANPGAIKIPLPNIVQWQAQTTLQTNFSQLAQIEPIIISIGPDKVATGSAIACGKIQYRY